MQPKNQTICGKSLVKKSFIQIRRRFYIFCGVCILLNIYAKNSVLYMYACARTRVSVKNTRKKIFRKKLRKCLDDKKETPTFAPTKSITT